VIATPLTACIKVVGDYIPSLDFFSLLLGADVALEDCHDYYRKLLELDRQGAQALAADELHHEERAAVLGLERARAFLRGRNLRRKTGSRIS